MIQETDQSINECINDLQAVRQLKNISFKAVQADINEVQVKFNILTNEVGKEKIYQENPLYNEQDELFLKNLKEFHAEVSKKLDFLNLENERFHNEVKKVFDFFGADQTENLTSEIMIGYISKFITAFEVLADELLLFTIYIRRHMPNKNGNLN